jgi:hypothetical protein
MRADRAEDPELARARQARVVTRSRVHLGELFRLSERFMITRFPRVLFHDASDLTRPGGRRGGGSYHQKPEPRNP